eukprot:COSAG01_NODE_7214_length_3303_cov_2.044944_2_plen_132_part_00
MAQLTSLVASLVASLFMLKSAVDCQIFITFLLSFILRVLPRIKDIEPLTTSFYGWVLLISFFLLLVAAFVLSVTPIRRRCKFRQRLMSVVHSSTDVYGFDLGLANRDMSPIIDNLRDTIPEPPRAHAQQMS